MGGKAKHVFRELSEHPNVEKRVERVEAWRGSTQFFTTARLIYIFYENEWRTIDAWCSEFGFDKRRLRDRLMRGYTVESAFYRDAYLQPYCGDINPELLDSKYFTVSRDAA